MAKFPEPPKPLAVPPEISTLAAGTLLWRIYFAGGAHPVNWRDFRHWGPAIGGRFDHHDPPSRLQAKGILYGAAHPVTCLAEVFQATRVVDRAGSAPWLVAFETTRDVLLLDLTGAWPTLAGASMAICSGRRDRARRWSQAIYAAYPGVEGLLYGSSMLANKPCVALYERAQTVVPGAPTFHRALSDLALLAHLNAAATTIGYGLV